MGREGKGREKWDGCDAGQELGRGAETVFFFKRTSVP